jgi:hypothetical protein
MPASRSHPAPDWAVVRLASEYAFMNEKQNKILGSEDTRKLLSVASWEPPSRKEGLGLLLAAHAGASLQGTQMPTGRPAIKATRNCIDRNDAHRLVTLIGRGAIHG